jgi:hypothetical protein
MTHLYILEVTSTGWHHDYYFDNAIIKLLNGKRAFYKHIYVSSTNGTEMNCQARIPYSDKTSLSHENEFLIRQENQLSNLIKIIRLLR